MQTRYISESQFTALGIDWDETIGTIDKAVGCLAANDFAQPIKPYLRFGDPRNRIIAMPAYVGGECNMAGIKWIASFPGNISKGIPRASSAIILNDTSTGQIKAVINTALVSAVRTASVSGWVVKKYLAGRGDDKLNIGIVGWGPIGRHHFAMLRQLIGERIDRAYLYDLNGIPIGTLDDEIADRVILSSGWDEVYRNSDIFVTCTVASEPYIEGPPRQNSLYLNVSLRDFKPSVYEYFINNIVVDSWDEVCRENTDIERMHLQKGLRKEQARSLADLYRDGCAAEPYDAPVFFNPMGMAIFDIAIGAYFYQKAVDKGIGTVL